MAVGLWQLLWLLGTWTCICHACVEISQNDKKDERVYSFAYGANNKPLQYLNEQSELEGFNYNVIRSVCKLMKRNCQHIVHYDMDRCWDSKKKSDGLNNRWWDVCVGLAQTPIRRLSYSFLEFGPYVTEPEAYLYVRYASGIQLDRVGFRVGQWFNPTCLEKFAEKSLDDNSFYYETDEEMADDLHNGTLDAMFTNTNIAHDHRFIRVWEYPVTCGLLGSSLMTRKDMLHRFTWFTEGLQILKEAGDYKWMCNMASRDGENVC